MEAKMAIDLKRLDALIDEFHNKNAYLECFLEQVVAGDARGIDNLERVRESAAFYGDSNRLAFLVQLVFIRTLANRPLDGEAWAAEALEYMDSQVLRMRINGACVSWDMLIRQIEYEECLEKEQNEIEGAVRDLDT